MQVRGAQGLQSALQPIGLLAGYSQALAGRFELGGRAVARFGGRGQPAARGVQASLVFLTLLAGRCQLLLKAGQARIAIGLARLIDGEVGFQRVDVLDRCAPGVRRRRGWRRRRARAAPGCAARSAWADFERRNGLAQAERAVP